MGGGARVVTRAVEVFKAGCGVSWCLASNAGSPLLVVSGFGRGASSSATVFFFFAA